MLATEAAAGFENLVIYNKCKTVAVCLMHYLAFENLVIYNKCKTVQQQ